MTDKGDVVGKVDEWASCYDLSYRGIIVPEAFGHPAKMSRGLLTRILRHAKEEGWLWPGAIILDPFGGIGSTGILGAYEGYSVVCVELEQKFVDLAKQNIALHAKKLAALGCPQPVIIQGDSRRLCEILQGADLIVSSPPYSDCPAGAQGTQQRRAAHSNYKFNESKGDAYGTFPGQLGAMKPGSVDAVVSSPPYAGALGNRQHEGDQQKYYDRQKRYNEAHPEHKRPDPESMCYPCSDGNLAAMKPGDVSAIISSPPYEGSLNSTDTDFIRNRLTTGLSGSTKLRGKTGAKSDGQIYGNAEGQLGNSQGPTFWETARDIVAQCLQILRPGGYAIWVVKDFVRAKKRVDFTGDWRKLCESVGFTTIHEHHALLVKETKHSTFFGTETTIKARKSFFRRLCESKGSPRIDFEVVLCTRKPQ